MQQLSPSGKDRIFFPNLDGLRFISFFVVFLYHSYLSFYIHLKESQPESYGVFKFLFQNGYLGVNFFFVLSGFLITYLLIREKESSGKINVGNFYMRRILRIWPLFYMCIFIGFVLHPLSKLLTGEVAYEPANPWYYLGFAANFDYIHMTPERPNGIVLPVLWSVCVEEQFYLTWPLILGMAPLRKWKYVFLFIVAGSLIFRMFYTGGSDAVQSVRYFHTFSLIGDMALGGGLAYFCSYENKFKRFITNLSRTAIAGIYVATAVVFLFRQDLFPPGLPIVFERLVIGSLFGLIILEQNYSVNSFFKLGQFKRISRLGIYTYGLYCLHLLGITFVYKLMGKLNLDSQSPALTIVATVLSLAISIAISWASYNFYEKQFLKIKARFAVVPTPEPAGEFAGLKPVSLSRKLHSYITKYWWKKNWG